LPLQKLLSCLFVKAMARACDMDASIKTGDISDESKGITKGELIRDYTPVAGVQWRFGKPNYARVNQTYFQHRTKKACRGKPGGGGPENR